MDNNLGLIPLRLGTARIEEYSYKMIHYYDLTSIISEIEKLQRKSRYIIKVVCTNKNYSWDVSNDMKVLEYIEEKVEYKILNILPHQKRVRRGLINGLGSIFKSISGNLDAEDGERYENSIINLQKNQERIS